MKRDDILKELRAICYDFHLEDYVSMLEKNAIKEFLEEKIELENRGIQWRKDHGLCPSQCQIVFSDTLEYWIKELEEDD